MPKVHTVNKARKAIPSIGVKKGEPYYWWKKRLSVNGSGVVIKSKTRPKQSQLSSSPFWSEVYSIQEDAADSPADIGDVESAVEDIKGRLESLRDETQEKFDNMPEGLQQGDTGQMLEERVSAIDDVISELEGIDCDFDEDDVDVPKDEDKEDVIAAAKDEKLDEAWTQVTDALGNISCS